jgi:isopenicillin N synthase-like dioxygenase
VCVGLDHPVPDKLVGDVLDSTRKFLFEAPQSVKDSIGLRMNPNGGRGYQRFAENVTYGSVDLHEGVDFLRDYDSPPSWLHSLDGLSDVYNAIVTSKNMFPPTPDGFPDLLRDYILGMKRVGHGLMRALALGLNLPETYFNALCTDPYWSMRLIGYPSVSKAADILARRPGDAEAVSAKSVGVGEHCDYGCWTLLAVDPKVPSALQVRNAAGQWIPADPIPGALVVNIGDLLSLWSGGMYQSTPHRVVNHMTLNRVSVPFFFDPNFTAPAVPLPEVRDAIARAGGPEPLWQARLRTVQDRMGFAQCAQGSTSPMFGLYHLRKVSTNFML